MSELTFQVVSERNYVPFSKHFRNAWQEDTTLYYFGITVPAVQLLVAVVPFYTYGIPYVYYSIIPSTTCILIQHYQGACLLTLVIMFGMSSGKFNYHAGQVLVFI